MFPLPLQYGGFLNSAIKVMLHKPICNAKGWKFLKVIQKPATLLPEFRMQIYTWKIIHLNCREMLRENSSRVTYRSLNFIRGKGKKRMKFRLNIPFPTFAAAKLYQLELSGLFKIGV